MDSAKLVEMVQVYEKNHAKDPTNSIDSITIIRNGYIVADIYLDPLYPQDTQHVLHSSAKSIMPALVGIAIEQGYIESVDVPVIEFFKDEELENGEFNLDLKLRGTTDIEIIKNFNIGYSDGSLLESLSKTGNEINERN